MTETLKPRAASQDFEKQLASVTLPAEGTLKEKEKEIPPEVVEGPHIQTPNKVEALVFIFRIMKIVVISSFVLKDQFY